MHLASLMLRVLLALALTANGVGSVFAATRMQISSFGADAAVVDAAVVDAAQPDAPAPDEACEEHAGMDATAMHDDGVPSPMSGAADEDCCDSGLCVCACVMHAVAGIAKIRVIETSIDRDTTAQVLDTGHAAPALPHLIRPPIG